MASSETSCDRYLKVALANIKDMFQYALIVGLRGGQDSGGLSTAYLRPQLTSTVSIELAFGSVARGRSPIAM